MFRNRSEQPDAVQPGWGEVLRRALPALLLATLTLAFFLGNAFTIDDATFLDMADHVLRDPIHPTAFDIPCSLPSVRLSSVLATGPVMAYLLVPAVLTSHGEWVAHGIQLGFVALAILATVRLGGRIGLPRPNAMAAGLLVGATPAVLGMASTAMADVPAMALGVFGIDQLTAFATERKLRHGVTAALGLGLAACTRSQLLLLVGVGALLLWPPRNWLGALVDKKHLVRWWPLAVAAVLSFLLVRLTRDPGQVGMGVAQGIRAHVVRYGMERRLVSFAAHLVLSLPFGLPWLALRFRALWRSRVLWAGVPTAVVLIYRGGDVSWLYRGITPLAAALGAAAVTDVLVQGWRHRDPVRLALGAWLLLPLPVIIYPQMAPKYLIASAPAVALLVASELRFSEGRVWYHRLVLGLACTLGVALGVAILDANRRYAEVDRIAAREVILPAVARGERVWFSGSFGLYWYARRAGARCLGAEPLRSGELLVVGFMPDAARVAAVGKTLVRAIEDARPGGRTMSAEDHAGFFADGWGPLPWALGEGLIQRISVYRVN
jgi:hypothetical protein